MERIGTAKIMKDGQINIPLNVRARVGFKEGSRVSVVAYDDRVELRPVEDDELSDAMACVIASEEVLAEAWDTPEEDEAWKDL